MTSQPSRRVRRRQFTNAIQGQATTAARPAQPAHQAARPARRAPAQAREHHVTTDYGYIRKDLWTILGVTIVVLAFIGGMAFVL